MNYCIYLYYGGDDSPSYAELRLDSLADAMMISRGWLMASTATKVELYDFDGALLASYIR